MIIKNINPLKYMTNYSKKVLKYIRKNANDISNNYILVTENKNNQNKAMNFKDNNHCKRCDKTIYIDSKYYKFCRGIQ